MARILVAEDEQAINELMVWNLQLVGHRADSAFDGAQALRMCHKQSYDLVLLDVMLPKLDGFSIKQKLPETLPVIFVTAKEKLTDRLTGLNLGADDYITKPFEMLELLARVEAVLRRTQKNTSSFTLGNVTADLTMRKVFLQGEEITLTPREYALLEMLILNKNLALSRSKLLELVWGFDYEGEERTVDVHIQRLRKKLGWETVIETVFKYGYRLNDHSNQTEGGL